MEAAALVVGFDCGGCLGVAEVLGCLDLPGLDGGFALFGECIPGFCNFVLPGLGGQRGLESGGVPVDLADGDDLVLDVGLLPSDRVDPDAAGDFGNQAEAGPGFYRLLLLGVAGEDDLGAALVGEMEDRAGLGGRQHAGLVDEDDRLVVDIDLVAVDHVEKFLDAVMGRGDVVSEFVGNRPGNGGGDQAASVVAVEVREGSEGCGFAGAGGAFDDCDGAGAAREADGFDLFG